MVVTRTPASLSPIIRRSVVTVLARCDGDVESRAVAHDTQQDRLRIRVVHALIKIIHTGHALMIYFLHDIPPSRRPAAVAAPLASTCKMTTPRISCPRWSCCRVAGVSGSTWRPSKVPLPESSSAVFSLSPAAHPI